VLGLNSRDSIVRQSLTILFLFILDYPSPRFFQPDRRNGRPRRRGAAEAGGLAGDHLKLDRPCFGGGGRCSRSRSRSRSCCRVYRGRGEPGRVLCVSVGLFNCVPCVASRCTARHNRRACLRANAQGVKHSGHDLAIGSSPPDRTL